MSNASEPPLFPILKGESVGVSGEFSGRVVIVNSPDEIHREWAVDDIPVINDNLVSHFESNPGDLDELLSHVSAVISETGESVGSMASIAFIREILCIVKVPDACFVLENDMRIRITAHESDGNIFFIE